MAMKIIPNTVNGSNMVSSIFPLAARMMNGGRKMIRNAMNLPRTAFTSSYFCGFVFEIQVCQNQRCHGIHYGDGSGQYAWVMASGSG